MRASIIKKTDKIKELIKEINNHKVITLVSLEGIPSRELQSLRHKFGDKLKLFITTKNNTIRALKDCKRTGIEELINLFKGSCCIGLSNEDPFKLSVMLKKNKTPSPAKAGQKAPYDILIKAGPTPFVPGPVITDLASVGLKTKVEGGKLAIMADAVIAKQDEVINSLQASIMSRLGLTPMSTGLDLIAAYEEGSVYLAKDLMIDVESYKSKIGEAYLKALNLAFNAEITIPEVINSLIQVAYTQAMNLSFNACIISKENADKLLIKGNAEAIALAGQINWEVK